MTFNNDYVAHSTFNVPDVLAQLPAVVAKISDFRTLERSLSAWILALLRGHVPPTNLAEMANCQPTYKMFLPFRMSFDFPNCSPEQVHQLAICDAYMLVYSGWIDDVIDRLSCDEENGVLEDRQADAIMAYDYMIKHLQQLFPPNSDFWAYLQCLIQQFSDTMQWETLHKGHRVFQYSYDEFCSLAQGKMSLALINPIALSLLNNTPERLPSLVRAWREISVAIILFDDIQDWKTDLKESQFSFLVNQVLTSGRLGSTADYSQIVAWVEHSAVLPTLLQCTAAHLQEAQRFAVKSHAPGLNQLCQDCLDDIGTIPTNRSSLEPKTVAAN